MTRVAGQPRLVHPGGVGVAASPPQEHEHAAESTTPADPTPDHAPLLPAPLPCHDLARLPLGADGPADRPHGPGLRPGLAAVRRRQLAAVLRLLPPRPLVALGL